MRMIQELRREIDGLKQTISILESKDQAQPLAVVEGVVSPNSVQHSYTAAAAQGGESVSEDKIGGAASEWNIHASSSGQLVADSEKKFNVVLCGISECPLSALKALQD